MRLLFGSRIATGLAGVVTAGAIAAGTVAVIAERSDDSGDIVVGFGDSVAAGYGLSVAGDVPPSHAGDPSSDRYRNGTLCSTTPQAYSCQFAEFSGADVGASHNFSIQGANSADVLNLELRQAEYETDHGTLDAGSVDAVTLTVGANDVVFSQCLSAELQGSFDAPRSEGDHCVTRPNSVDDLQVSDEVRVQLHQLQTNLPLIIDRFEADFPNARIYVTHYYGAFPDDAPARTIPCPMYAIPSVMRFINNLGGLFDLGRPNDLGEPNVLGMLEAGAALYDAIRQEAERYLPSQMAQFQHRFHVIENLMVGQLNNTIDIVRGEDAPVTLVNLDFHGHDMCNPESYVFAPRVSGTLGPFTDLHVTPGDACLLPTPASDGGEKTFGINLDFEAPFAGRIVIGALFTSNCIAHPTHDGQVAIANAILGASQQPPPLPRPPIIVSPSGQSETPAPSEAQTCSLQGGAEGGTDLSFTVSGLSCQVGQGVVEAALGALAGAGRRLEAAGFSCEIGGPDPVQPGSRITCTMASQIVSFMVPG